MATPAAVLSILVKTQGVQQTAGQLNSLDTNLGKVSGAGTRMGRDVEKGAKRGSGALSQLKDSAKVAGAAFLGAGLVVGIKKSVDAASDLGEQVNKTKVVFRGSEKSVLSWSKGTARAIGTSRREALEAAGVFGNMLVPMGKSREEAAGMSKRMVNLAGDMASFNNASPKDTLEALRSGLAGETEPLRKFGVFLSEGRIQAEALATGLVKTTKDTDKIKAAQIAAKIAQNNYNEAVKKHGKNSMEAQKALGQQAAASSRLDKATAGTIPKLTAAQKAQASYSLMLKDTKDAQGDFGRTSDSLANQQRILGARFEDLSAKVGSVLVPVISKALGWFLKLWTQFQTGTGFGGQLIDVFNRVVAAMLPFGQSIQIIVGYLQQHAGLTKVLAIGLGVLTGAIIAVNVAMSLNPFVAAGIAIAALVVAVVTAYQKFETFRNVVDTVVNAVKSAIPTMVTIAKGAMTAFLAVFRAVWPIIKGYFQGGFTALKGIITGAAQVLGGAVKVIKGILTGNFGEIWDGIKGIFRGGFTALKGIITGAGQSIGNAAKTIGTAIIDAIVAAVKAGASKLVDGIKGVVGGAKDAVKGALGAINPFGDGLGFKPIAPIPGGIKGLMGANASLAPFASVGSSFGLHVTSGKRAAGSRTSSGGISYHGSGQAIDLGNGRGPDAAKLSAFKALKSRYGSRLAELIYTPGGVGIKDGRPFRYTGQVAQDHYDHVHVAFTGGRYGSALGQAGNRGDGLGAFTGDGPGVGGNVKAVWQFLRSKGMSPAQAAGIIGVMQGESGQGLSTTATNPSSGAYGIAQWLGGRKAALMAKRNPSSLSTQLNHLWSELQGPERAAFSKIKGAHSIDEAVNAWLFGFERPGPNEANLGARTANARNVFSALKGVGGGGGATSTGGAGASTRGAAVAAAKVNPLDQNLANADLAIEQAKRGSIKIGGVGGRRISSAMQQVAAMSAKRRLIGARIRSIRKALKGKLSPTKRLALTQELTQRLQEHAQLGTDIGALRKPDVAGAADAAGTAATAADYAQAQISLAGLTPDKADDLAALTGLQSVRQQELAAAMGSGDPRDIAQAADNLKSVNDAIEQLQGTIEDQIQAMKAHTQAVQALQAEIAAQNAITGSTIGISLREAQRALADMISGQIGGYGGVAGRAMSAGAGTVVRY